MQTTIGERAGEPGTGPFVMSEGGRGGGVPVLAARVDGGVDWQWGKGGVGIRRYFMSSWLRRDILRKLPKSMRAKYNKT